MSALVTETHVSLAIAVWNHVRQDRQHPSGAQLIADSEDRLSSENKALRQSLRELGRERLEESIRADCLKQEVDRLTKWREEQPWLAEIHSYQQQVSRLTERAETLEAALETCRKQLEIRERIGNAAEAELDAIKRGHGEFGRYEKLRLKYAEVVARAEKAEEELAKERARLDWLDEKLHVDLSRSTSSSDEYYVTFPKDRSPRTGPILSEKYISLRDAIDVAMKEDSK